MNEIKKKQIRKKKDDVKTKVTSNFGNFIRCAFYHMPQMDMNPSRRAVFGMPRLYF